MWLAAGNAGIAFGEEEQNPEQRQRAGKVVDRASFL